MVTEIQAGGLAEVSTPWVLFSSLILYFLLKPELNSKYSIECNLCN